MTLVPFPPVSDDTPTTAVAARAPSTTMITSTPMSDAPLVSALSVSGCRITFRGSCVGFLGRSSAVGDAIGASGDADAVVTYCAFSTPASSGHAGSDDSLHALREHRVGTTQWTLGIKEDRMFKHKKNLFVVLLLAVIALGAGSA